MKYHNLVEGSVSNTEGVPGPSEYHVSKNFRVTKTEAPKYRYYFS